MMCDRKRDSDLRRRQHEEDNKADSNKISNKTRIYNTTTTTINNNNNSSTRANTPRPQQTCAFPNPKPLTLVRKSGREYHSGVSSFTSERAEVHMSQLRATLLNSLSATSKVPFCPPQHQTSSNARQAGKREEREVQGTRHHAR